MPFPQHILLSFVLVFLISCSHRPAPLRTEFSLHETEGIIYSNSLAYAKQMGPTQLGGKTLLQYEFTAFNSGNSSRTFNTQNAQVKINDEISTAKCTESKNLSKDKTFAAENSIRIDSQQTVRVICQKEVEPNSQNKLLLKDSEAVLKIPLSKSALVFAINLRIEDFQ